MRSNLVIDIETRADPRLDTPEYWQGVMEGIADNKAIKDPVKQAAWKGRKLEDYKASMALRATTGKVAAIGVAEIDDPYAVKVAIDLESEENVLRQFVGLLGTVYHGERIVCGFNCREFDIPFISARCAIHGIDLPRWWPFMRDWKNVADLYDVLGRTGKLDEWLTAFGMEGKSCSGADSLLLTQDELEEYLRIDVFSTASLFSKLWQRFPALWSKNETRITA